MPVPSSARRAATLSVLALVGALLPVLAAPVANADPGCVTEVAPPGQLPLPLPPPIGPGDRCDDSVAPETSLGTVTPSPNQLGFIAQDSITLAFSGAHPDTDLDPIGFECQFFNTPEAPADWQKCTSPVTYADLEDTRRELGGKETPYTFRVRAFDTEDRPIDATSPSNPLLGSGGAATDEPDVDQTPAETSFKVDTRVPVAQIFDEPFDPETPELPMLTSNSLRLRITGGPDPALTFACDIDGREVPCRDDHVVFQDLGPGTQTLSVSVTDRAGNTSAKPATTTFTVPENLVSPGKRWRTRTSDRYFAGDYLEATRYSSTISVEGTDVREVRLLATTGPDTGELKFKTPDGVWRKVKLGGRRTERSAVVIVRNAQSGSFSGPLTFRVMSRGKPVQLDAIMLR